MDKNDTMLKMQGMAPHQTVFEKLDEILTVKIPGTVVIVKKIRILSYAYFKLLVLLSYIYM